jgi:hypothetical protein
MELGQSVRKGQAGEQLSSIVMDSPEKILAQRLLARSKVTRLSSASSVRCRARRREVILRCFSAWGGHSWSGRMDAFGSNRTANLVNPGSRAQGVFGRTDVEGIEVSRAVRQGFRTCRRTRRQGVA